MNADICIHRLSSSQCLECLRAENAEQANLIVMLEVALAVADGMIQDIVDAAAVVLPQTRAALSGRG